MRRWAGLLLALWAGLALADGTNGAANSRISRGNYLRIPSYQTPGTGAQSYFVNASTGSDSFNCTSASTPCLTHQGVINKLPKLLHDGVTITAANGNYPCFYAEGFHTDPGIQHTTGGLYFTGNLITATVATGTATGTSTSGSVGSASTFGTLTDSGQTWTVNNLRGKLVSIGGTEFVVSSNTATAITTVGTCSTCAGSVAYTVQAPGWNINTACNQPATPLAATTANKAAVFLMNDQGAYTTSVLAGATIVLQNVGFTNAAGNALLVNSGGNFGLVNFTMALGTNGVAFTPGVTPSMLLQTGSFTGTVTSYMLMSANASPVVAAFNIFSFGNNAGLISANGGRPSMPFLNGSEANNATVAGVLGSSLQASSIQNDRFACASSAGWGIAGGAQNTTAFTDNTQTYFIDVENSDISSTCGNGLVAQYSGRFTLFSNTIAGATNGILGNWGSTVNLVAGGTQTITGGTNDWNLDNGAMVGALSDINTGSCAVTLSYGSRICK